MKFGIRKPSIKKSISARTTGKLKRKIKKSVNPLYGKRGMGVINNPKKAAYNAIYNKTTISAKDVLKPNKRTKSYSTSSSNGALTFSFVAIIGILIFLIILL